MGLYWVSLGFLWVSIGLVQGLYGFIQVCFKIYMGLHWVSSGCGANFERRILSPKPVSLPVLLCEVPERVGPILRGLGFRVQGLGFRV